MALGSTQPLTNEHQEYGGKGGRCVVPTTLLPSCADCLEIWDPQPPGALMACPSLHRICFTLYPLKGQHTLGERGPGILSKYCPKFVSSRILLRSCSEGGLVSCDTIRAAWSEFRIPVTRRNFYLLQIFRTGHGADPPWVPGFFPRTKVAGA